MIGSILNLEKVIRKNLFLLVIFSIFFSITLFDISIADSGQAEKTRGGEDIARVICNVVELIKNLGLPVMTFVILVSTIMALFGRLNWPAIAMLVGFTAVFFGADKLMNVFINGLNFPEAFDCSLLSLKSS